MGAAGLDELPTELLYGDVNEYGLETTLDEDTVLLTGAASELAGLE